MASSIFSDSPPSSYSLFFFLSLLLLLPDLHHCDDRFTDWASYRRSLLVASRRNSAASQISTCNGLLDPSQCNRSPNCRWCRSESVNDLCFHKSEAWRLPSQIFSCDQSLPSSRSRS